MPWRGRGDGPGHAGGTRIALTPALIPITLAGALNLALAVALLALNPRAAASRVFALILFVRTASHVKWAGVDLATQAGDAAAAAFWDRMYAHAGILVLFLMAWFLLVYPRRRAWVPRGPWVPAALLAGGVVLELAYLLDHRLFIPLTTPAFVVVGHLSSVLFAGAGLVFARDYVRAPAGLRRKSVELVAAGFALVGTYDGVLLVAGYPRSFYYETAIPAYGELMLAATAALFGGLVLVLARAVRQAAEPDLRRGARRFLALLALPALTALVTVAAPANPWGPTNLLFGGLWRLPLPLLVSYGLLRTELFDIDLRLRWTVQQGTIAAGFVGAFFAGNEAGRRVLPGEWAPWLGLAAAGMVVLGLAPLRRAAAGLAQRAVPLAETSVEALTARKIEVYRIALEQALGDEAALRPSDEALLAELRRDLGLSDRDHALLLHAVRRQAQGPGDASGLQVGGVLNGRYRLVEVLGEGAFGRTFLARDEARAGARVVVKALRPERARDPVMLREARAIQQVRDPHVVAFLDIEPYADQLLLVMEHIGGGSLAARLGKGPLRGAEFAAVAQDLLRALEAVHGAGLLHRDVKPSNVLLTSEGRAKLSDFGVAHLPGLETTRGGEGAPGTILYMSPEQARGKQVTARSDLFSAAATLYEALIGKRYLEPLANESVMELQLRAASAKPFTRRLDPPALRAWFAKALEPDPARRFRSAREMRLALEATRA